MRKRTPASKTNKKGPDVPFTVGKTVEKFKTAVGPDTFHTNTPVCIPLHRPFQKVSGKAGGLLRTGGQETVS